MWQPDEADNFILDTERVCLDFADGKIDRATARARLIAIGMVAEIVDEGLDEQESTKPTLRSARIIVCPHCGGDKGHDVPVDIDRRDGSLITHWRPCLYCGAEGDIEIEVEPIELEDFPAAYPP